ncbi:MAG: lysylphosphatidylglycerol synthase transmembrane domain-containing protein [Pseudohongiellaceae bacterium]|nr:lysylphosphatidylglycerol synthase transmembrane domain-containing protein [Pseudohongiellaceae bacterium]
MKWLITISLWLLALGLCAWLLQDFPLGDAFDAIKNLNLAQASIWLALNALILWLSCYRWQSLGKATAQLIGLWPLLLIRLGGQTISFITPGPQFGGEPFQLYWLRTRCAITLSKAAIVLALDRAYELWVNFVVLITCLLSVLLWLPWAANNFVLSPSSATLILIGLILIPIGLALLRGQIKEKLSLVLEKIQSVEKQDQSKPRQAKRYYFIALLVSFFVWGGIFVELDLVLTFAGIDISLLETVGLLCVIRLAMLLPLPGGIGSIEAGVLFYFQALGLSTEAAFTFIALSRLRDVALLLIGFLSLYLLHKNNTDTKTL